MQTRPRLSLIMIAIAFSGFGCAPHSPGRGPSAAPQATTTDATKQFDPQPLKQVDEFVSALTPRDVVLRACKALNDGFGLTVGGDGYAEKFDERLIRGDAFSSRGGAMTISGKSIQIEAQWEGEGRTKVILRSDLPLAQYGAAKSVIHDAITAAAKAN